MRKIACIGLDAALIDRLKQLPVEDVTNLTKEQLVSGTGAVSATLVVISDRFVKPFELESLIDRFPDSKIAYLISYSANIAAAEEASLICRKLGILDLPPKHTVEQIAQKLHSSFLGGYIAPDVYQGKVIAFLGTLGQVGVTTTVLGLAEQLAGTTTAKIGVLSFNAFTPGDQYVAYKGSLLNQLHTQIHVLTPEELESHMHAFPKFHYLAGNADLTKRYRYSADAIEHLIAAARSRFDIVMIDAGCNPDNNLCLQALMQADMRVVVTTQQPAALHMWQQFSPVLQLVNGGEKMSFMMILNRYHATRGDARLIEKKMEVASLGVLPDLGEQGHLCEAEHRLLTTTDNKQYLEGIRAISELLQARYKLPQLAEGGRKGWWQALLGK
ncbi:AAA family ATPase [Paenibacillus algorifonticola]|uniref:AAA family ATPase n=1 Tax=Paenibacillus algorifonticola TaxID=684063 RepID=UPI003D2CA2C5